MVSIRKDSIKKRKHEISTLQGDFAKVSYNSPLKLAAPCCLGYAACAWYFVKDPSQCSLQIAWTRRFVCDINP